MGAIEKTYDNFLEFYYDMLPDGKMAKELDGFVFRGESSDRYELLPSALRNNFYNGRYANLNEGDKTIPNNEISEQAQMINEYLLLRKFYLSANHSGLKLPHIEGMQEDFFLDAWQKALDLLLKYKEWPPSELVELISLAQHHGLATRFLDWTFDINIALFFASRGACKRVMKNKNKAKNDEKIVIWSIKYVYSNNEKINLPLKFIKPSYYSNKNLNSQKGLLSYWLSQIERWVPTREQEKSAPVNRTSLDKLIEPYDQVKLYKFTIPCNECKYIFNYVSQLGYTSSRLFPGYDAVVKEIEDEIYIDKTVLFGNNKSKINESEYLN